VVAGPTGTRFLAARGAEVMRLDAPGSDESSGGAAVVPNDLMLGKRWAFLDLRQPEGKARFLELLCACGLSATVRRRACAMVLNRLIAPASEHAMPAWPGTRLYAR
jgi:hypothetical protein